MINFKIVSYILKAAVRDKVVLGLSLMVVLATSMSVFLGSAAISEKFQFVNVYAAGSLRLVCVLGIVLFAVLHIRRSFDSRDVDFMLSRPLSRLSFLISHFVAFAFLSVMFAALITGVIALSSFKLPNYDLLLWGFSLGMETIMMVNAALFFALVIPSAAASTMATIGLYVLCRLIGQVLGIIDRGGQFGIFKGASYLVEGISTLVPRIDLMTQTSWLIYGHQGLEGFVFAIVQTIVFSAVILSAAYLDLIRRQF